MSTKLRVRKGDLVQVLSGKDRGKQGHVIDAGLFFNDVERRRLARRHGHREAVMAARLFAGLLIHELPFAADRVLARFC